MIAGIIQLPGAYSPYNKLDKAKARQELVLDQMVKYGYLTAEQAAAAKAEPIVLRSSGLSKYPGGYFVDYVLQQLLDRYGAETVYNGGLRVYTTVDIDMQNTLEKAMSDVLDPQFPIVEGKTTVQAAGAFIDQHTGAIKAIAGGRRYDKRLGLNRAVASFRQPGSAFKPIADYTAALDLGMNAGDVIDDKPIEYPGGSGTWQPKNYGNVFKGLMTVREAVMDSRNSPAIQTLSKITPDVGYQYAMKLGNFAKLKASGSANDKTLSLAIGGLTIGVSPLELTSAYGVLGNGGVRVEPISILKVTDKNGNVLEENTPAKSVAVSEQTAYLMTDILKSVITGGTGTRANLGRPTAGKTGTTDDTADAWWVGYTPELVGGVWMGYDQPKGMSSVAGGNQPARIWKATMLAGLKDKAATDFPVPSGIVTGVTICGKSGKLPGPLCPASDLRTETYLAGREPTTTCDVHVAVSVCAEHPDRLAGPNCPAVTKVMTRRPTPYVPIYLRLKGGLAYPNDWAHEAPTKVCEYHNGTVVTPPTPPTDPTTPGGPPQP
jgi:penicillin-binding protein 1A